MSKQLELNLGVKENKSAMDTIVRRLNRRYDSEIKRVIDNRDRTVSYVSDRLSLMTEKYNVIYKDKTSFENELIPGDVLDLSGFVGKTHSFGEKSNYTSLKKFKSSFDDFGFYTDHFGVLWGYGKNDVNQLGIGGGLPHYDTPVQVSDIVGWDFVSASKTLSIGRVKNSGRTDDLYVWGTYQDEKSGEIFTWEVPTLIDTNSEDNEYYGVNYYVSVVKADNNAFIITKFVFGDQDFRLLPTLIPFGNDQCNIREMCEKYETGKVYSYTNWEIRSSAHHFMITTYTKENENDEAVKSVYINNIDNDTIEYITNKWIEWTDHHPDVITTKDVVSALELSFDCVLLWSPRNEGGDRVGNVLYQPNFNTDEIMAYGVDIARSRQEIYISERVLFPYRKNDLCVYLGKRVTTFSDDVPTQHAIMVSHNKGYKNYDDNLGGFEKSKIIYITEEDLKLVKVIKGMDSMDHPSVVNIPFLDPFLRILNGIHIGDGRNKNELFTLSLTFDEIMEIYYGNNPIIRNRLEYLQEHADPKKTV